MTLITPLTVIYIRYRTLTSHLLSASKATLLYRFQPDNLNNPNNPNVFKNPITL